MQIYQSLNVDILVYLTIKNYSICSKIHNFAYRKMYNNIRYDKDGLHY